MVMDRIDTDQRLGGLFWATDRISELLMGLPANQNRTKISCGQIWHVDGSNEACLKLFARVCLLGCILDGLKYSKNRTLMRSRVRQHDQIGGRGQPSREAHFVTDGFQSFNRMIDEAHAILESHRPFVSSHARRLSTA